MSGPNGHGKVDTKAMVETFPVSFPGFPFPCVVVTKGAIKGQPVWRILMPMLNPEDENWTRHVAERIARVLDEEGAPL